jgi:hypothetical protein
MSTPVIQRRGTTRFHIITRPDQADTEATFVAQVFEVPDHPGRFYFAVLSASGVAPAEWDYHPVTLGDHIMAHYMDRVDGPIVPAEVVRVNGKSLTVKADDGETWRLQVVL